MKDTMQVIFGLVGGLAIFIFGMNLMSESLQKVAGEKMKKILGLLTKNPLMGAIAGALVTAVLQSSSATTVMAIGFVGAGLMSLPQAISIIIGANIGTTITAQIIAFKITDYIYLFIFIGFIISFIAKSEKINNIGQTIFAFGLLFLGIETMGSVMKPLASSPIFTDMIGRVANIPVLGVLVGTFMTLIVQSSSATIAVLQNFASQAGADGVTSIIGLAGAIPILLGDNIGTTITALLASIGQSKDAKRTAAAHCIFNISGCLIFIWIVKPYAKFIQWISPQGIEVEVISRQIANAHTIFNLVMTIIWIPLVWLMVKIVLKLIPDNNKQIVDSSGVMYLDDKLLAQPAAALNLVAKEILHCSKVVGEMIQETAKLAKKEEKEQIKKIMEEAETEKKLNAHITEYLSNLFAGGSLTEEQATQTAGIMYVLSDIDRMASLTTDVANAIKDKIEKKYKYSKEAMKELEKSLSVMEGMYTEAMEIMTTGNEEHAKKILKKKGTILDLDIKMRKAHMERVAKGKCSGDLTAPYNKILHSIDRMGNSCVNIADAALERVDFRYFISLDESAEVMGNVKE
ncbi:MAG: Na/Pi cotransporter family protein [Lachnospiraceae bacterium]